MSRFALLALLALAGCRSTTGGAKGGLVPVKVAPGALAGAYAPRRIALLVGISLPRDPQWRPLRYAIKDAEDLAAALKDPQRGRFDRVITLTSPAQTTREGVLQALARLRAELTRPDDVVVVYFSAHGTLARDGAGELRRYLVTSDAEYRRIPQTALSMDRLKAEFDQLASRRRLLVLATCHSGSGKSLLPRELEIELAGIKAGSFVRPLEESSRASMVFSASDWGETAREDESLQNDIYTHFLIEALTGSADRNLDGAVTATEAHDFARRRTYAFTEGRQRPSAEILEVGADPVILAGAIERTGQPELFSYNPRLEGFTLKVDGKPRIELPGGVAVPAGKRRVELTKGEDLLLRREVTLDAGERLELDALLASPDLPRAVYLLGGGFGFLDRRSREQVLPAVFGPGVGLRLEGVPLRGLSLTVDLVGSTGQQHLLLQPGDAVPFRYTGLLGGATVAYTWRWRAASVELGPRVAALYLRRSFKLDTYQSSQSYLTISPGLVGSVGVPVWGRLELVAQGQLMLTYVMVDGVGQALGFAGGWAGMGYRF